MGNELKPVKLWSVLGNSQKLDGGAMFGNAPRPMWEKWIAPDELGRIPLACRTMLAQIGNELVLCETGIGAFFEPTMAERYGVQDPTRHLLLENLNKIGFSHEQINYVILSHLHFDHAGGLLPSFAEQSSNKQNNVLFPNAKYVVGKEAWDRAQSPHFRDKASFIPGLTEKLKASGRLIVVDGEHLPGSLQAQVQFMYSNGHTPGQMHTVIKGPQGQVIFAGDMIPGMAWVHLPITMGYDRFPEKLIEEKQLLYKKAVPENWWLFFTHDPSVCAAHVTAGEKGRFQPTDPQREWAAFAL